VTVPKTVLITGASSGFGRALVSHLRKHFYIIAVARRFDRMNELFGDDPKVECFQVDLGRRFELKDFLDDLMTRHNVIPYLINNAGTMMQNSLNDIDMAEMEYSFAVNALAPCAIMKVLLPAMRRLKFGRIINLTSGAPFNCFPGFAAYSASKAALNALTVTAARENVDLDIKINLMSPGPVRTEMAPEALMEPQVAFPTVDHLLSLPKEGATGRFFWLGRELPLSPDFEGVEWLSGTASNKFPRVI
jgi:short-subunit dehydrogenase